MLCQIYTVCESAAKDPSHELALARPRHLGPRDELSQAGLRPKARLSSHSTARTQPWSPQRNCWPRRSASRRTRTKEQQRRAAKARAKPKTGTTPFEPSRPRQVRRTEARRVEPLLVWQQRTQGFQFEHGWVAGELSSTPSSCFRAEASSTRSANRLSMCFPSGNLVSVGSRRLTAGLVQGLAAHFSET